MIRLPSAYRGRSFQSTLPAWGETSSARRRNRPRSRFQSTLPAWGETPPAPDPPCRAGNFNPLSPHGERPGTFVPHPKRGDFNPLSPHGERRCAVVVSDIRDKFQSTLPAWGETKASAERRGIAEISIHSPRMGRDALRHRSGDRPQAISIHSPRMGRDERLARDHAAALISIHSPRMGRDGCHCPCASPPDISIHSPRMGRDLRFLIFRQIL